MKSKCIVYSTWRVRRACPCRALSWNGVLVLDSPVRRRSAAAGAAAAPVMCSIGGAADHPFASLDAAEEEGHRRALNSGNSGHSLLPRSAAVEIGLTVGSWRCASTTVPAKGGGGRTDGIEPRYIYPFFASSFTLRRLASV